MQLLGFDPELGWSYIRNYLVSRRLAAPAGSWLSALTSTEPGCSAPETTVTPDRPSLLLVGDSFTMGHGLNYDDSIA